MKRYGILFGGSLLLGCLLSAYLPEPVATGVFLLSALFGFCFLFSQRRGAALVFLFLFAAGFLYTAWLNRFYEAAYAIEPEDRMVLATIEEMQMCDGGSFQYEWTLSTGERVQVYAKHSIPDAEIGDAVLGELHLSAPSVEVAASLRGKTLAYCGLAADEEAFAVIKCPKPSLSILLKRMSYRYQRKLLSNPGLDNDTAAVLLSLLLGNRSFLSEPLQQLYQNAGASHFFAVSGLHLMVFCGFFLWLLPRHAHKLRFGVVLLLIIAFTILTGGHASTRRAAVMLTLQLLAPCLHRNNDGINTLFWAGFFLVCLHPDICFDLGFLLSFSIMLGYVALAPAINAFVLQRRDEERVPFLLQQIILAGCLLLSILPVSMLSFGTLSLMTPISNFLLGLVMTPILLLGFCYLLIVPFWDVALLRTVLTVLVHLANRLAKLLGRVPHSVIGLQQRSMMLFFVLLLLGFGIWFLTKKPALLKCNGMVLVIFFCGALIQTSFQNVTEQALYLLGDRNGTALIFVDRGEVSVFSASDDHYLDTAVLRFLQQHGFQEITAYYQLLPDLKYTQDALRLEAGLPIRSYFHPAEGLPPSLRYTDEVIALSGNETVYSSGYQAAFEEDGSFVLSIRGRDFHIGKASLLKQDAESEVLFLTTARKRAWETDQRLFLLNPPHSDWNTEGMIRTDQAVFRLQITHELLMVEELPSLYWR